MTIYARDTSVSVERSRAEIEQILVRYGAADFGYVSQNGGREVAIGFRVNRRAVRMRLSMPDPELFAKTPTGKRRSLEVGKSEWERGCRQSWRALVLVIKAKLEAIESGIATFEDEWLAYLVLPDWQTVGEKIGPQIAANETGPLLLGLES